MTKVLLVHDDPGQEARVQVAVALVRALPDGVLHCLDVTPNPTIYDPGWSIAPPLVLDETEREVADHARLRERIAGEGIEWRWAQVARRFRRLPDGSGAGGGRDRAQPPVRWFAAARHGQPCLHTF